MDYDEWCRQTGLAGWAMWDLCPWPDGMPPPIVDRPLVGAGVAAGALVDGFPIYRGGVWHDDHRALSLAKHYDSARCVLTCAPPDNHHEVVNLPGTWLYAGPVRDQFGHFLTESLARLWALDHPDIGKVDGLLWSGLGDFGVPSFVQPVLEHLADLPPSRFVTDGVVQPDRLILPRQEGGSGVGMLLSHGLAATLRRRFAAIGTAPAERRGMLYVSRSAMAHNDHWQRHGSGQLSPGPVIDAAFERAGYRVFHPETASLSEQIKAYRSAAVLVLDEGSALHLAGLVAHPETQVVVLCRRPQYRMLFEAHLRILLGREARVEVRMVEGDSRPHAHGFSVTPDPALFAALLMAAEVPPVLL